MKNLLNLQSYRLSFWRVANDEINYRRFFDIFDLAGICTENPEVFKAIHALVFKLVQKKLVNGVRIDHIDGLRDPENYLISTPKELYFRLKIFLYYCRKNPHRR